MSQPFKARQKLPNPSGQDSIIQNLKGPRIFSLRAFVRLFVIVQTKGATHLLSMLKKQTENTSIEFLPQLTPREMLQMGVFGGWYFEGCHDEYPIEWFEDAKLSSEGFDTSLNHFGVAAGQSREHWARKGWITTEDPLGWFQWYCRYCLGRRIKGVDQFQIGRWKQFGPRHIGGIRKNCEPHDISCRRGQRQALLQWAYDPYF